MNKRRRDVIEACEVSRLVEYDLGGVPQKVLVEGMRATNPLLVFLHGGPGSPLPFSAGMRGMYPELYERYVLVSWDQHGCGINDGPVGERFGVDDYATMTADLLRALKRDFPDNELNVLGTSWGSVLAARAAVAVPDLIGHAMVYGQVLRELGFNDEVFEALGCALPERLQPRLAELRGKPVHTPEEALLVSRWIGKYTEGYQAKSIRSTAGGSVSLSALDMVRALLGSPDYRLRDVKAAVVSNSCMKSARLLTEILGLDLSGTLAEVRVPYLIMQGEKDIVTSTRAIRAYLSEKPNDNLSFHLVEGAGHMPGGQAMDDLLARIHAFTGADGR